MRILKPHTANIPAPWLFPGTRINLNRAREATNSTIDAVYDKLGIMFWGEPKQSGLEKIPEFLRPKNK